MQDIKNYEDGYWQSEDGLKLHYRDYPSDSVKAPVICIPGLTRNARDFAHLGKTVGGDRRVIMVELRGRGESEYAKDSSSYHPRTYVSDIIALMEDIGLPEAVFFGTSLGGIITMVMAATKPELIAGALLNDIGPEVDKAGLERIGGYVGQGRSYDTWAHAARETAIGIGDIYPDYTLKDWIAFVKKTYRMNDSGRIKLDYDMKIAEPFDNRGGGAEALWQALEGLKDKPVLLVRGELSDLFSHSTATKMLEILDNVELATIPRVGHAPSLEEPASLDAIAQFLKRVD